MGKLSGMQVKAMDRIKNKLNELGGRWFSYGDVEYWDHASKLVGVTIDKDEAYVSKTSATASREYAELLLKVLDIVEFPID